LIWLKMAFASMVGEYRPPLRLNSLTPTDISACFIARDTPGDDTLSSRAAPPTVPVTMMARMISIWRSVSILWSQACSWRRSRYQVLPGGPALAHFAMQRT